MGRIWTLDLLFPCKKTEHGHHRTYTVWTVFFLWPFNTVSDRTVPYPYHIYGLNMGIRRTGTSLMVNLTSLQVTCKTSLTQITSVWFLRLSRIVHMLYNTIYLRLAQTVNGISIYCICAVYDRIYAIFPYTYTVYEGKWIHSESLRRGVILQLLKSWVRMTQSFLPKAEWLGS